MLIFTNMNQSFQPGDFLIFQLESGYGLLRLLRVEGDSPEAVWHVSAYRDFFPDTEIAEKAAADPGSMTIEIPHVALTQRAFESTQLARLNNVELTENEVEPLTKWKEDRDRSVSDRSIRLLMGYR